MYGAVPTVQGIPIKEVHQMLKHKKMIAIVFAMMLLATLALPGTALAHPGDGNNGCHFGPLNEITPPFDGRGWGEFNSTNAQSEPGAPADRINQREACRS